MNVFKSIVKIIALFTIRYDIVHDAFYNPTEFTVDRWISKASNCCFSLTFPNQKFLICKWTIGDESARHLIKASLWNSTSLKFKPVEYFKYLRILRMEVEMQINDLFLDTRNNIITIVINLLTVLMNFWLILFV